MRHLHIALAVILALLAMASCGRYDPPALSTSPPSISAPNRFGAPLVTNPRDIRRNSDDPCVQLLTPAQQRVLGFAKSGRIQELMVGGRACNWADRRTQQALTLIPHPNRDFLVDTYRARLLPVFQPSMVVGLPAVREQSTPTSIACTITIGIAENQALEVTYTQLGLRIGEIPDDPCGRGERVAEVVIGNLPPLH